MNEKMFSRCGGCGAQIPKKLNNDDIKKMSDEQRSEYFYYICQQNPCPLNNQVFPSHDDIKKYIDNGVNLNINIDDDDERKRIIMRSIKSSYLSFKLLYENGAKIPHIHFFYDVDDDNLKNFYIEFFNDRNFSIPIIHYFCKYNYDEYEIILKIFTFIFENINECFTDEYKINQLSIIDYFYNIVKEAIDDEDDEDNDAILRYLSLLFILKKKKNINIDKLFVNGYKFSEEFISEFTDNFIDTSIEDDEIISFLSSLIYK